MLASPLLYNNRQIILERAATLLLPAMYEWPTMAEEGGFVAYGPRLAQLYRDVFARQTRPAAARRKAHNIVVERPPNLSW